MTKEEIAEQRRALQRRRPVLSDEIITVTVLLVVLKLTGSMAAGWTWLDTILVIIGWIFIDIAIALWRRSRR